MLKDVWLVVDLMLQDVCCTIHVLSVFSPLPPPPPHPRRSNPETPCTTAPLFFANFSTQETDYQRANMTWQLFLYRGAELILPSAPVEIRSALSDPNPCPAQPSLLRPSELKVWGTVRGENGRLIIGSGEESEVQ